MSDHERAQKRFKELCEANATFHCPICDQDVPVADIHHHFVLNGYAGCKNKEMDEVPQNTNKIPGKNFVAQSIWNSIERQVIHQVLLGE